jgi:hypothetical protein
MSYIAPNPQKLIKLLSWNSPRIVSEKTIPDSLTSSTWFVKSKVLSLFKDNNLGSYAEKHWTSDVISLEQFVKFITEEAMTDGTTSRCGQYVKYTHAYYDVPMEQGIPDYSMIDPKIREFIEPKRIEHKALFILHHGLETDPLIKTFPPRVLKETFQGLVNAPNPKYFDKLYPNVGLAIEVHEETENHVNSQNDKDKLVHACNQDIIIVYFKMIDCPDKELNTMSKYLEDKIQEIRYVFVSLVLRKFPNSHKMFYMQMFKNHITECKNTVEKKIVLMGSPVNVRDETRLDRLTEQSDRYSEFLEGKEDCMLIKSFEWEKELENKPDDRIITSASIAKMLKIDSDDKISHDALRNEFQYVAPEDINEETMCVNWDGMIYILMSLPDSVLKPEDKNIVLRYLIKGKKIYKCIFQHLTYLDKLFRSQRGDLQKVYESRETSMAMRHANRVYNLEKKIKNTDGQNKIIKKAFNKLVLDVKCVCEPGSRPSSIRNLRITLDSVKDIVCPTAKPTRVTINCTEVGKSVFHELPRFQFVFTRNVKDCIDINTFHHYCGLANIPIRTQDKVVKVYGKYTDDLLSKVKWLGADSDSDTGDTREDPTVVCQGVDTDLDTDLDYNSDISDDSDDFVDVY